MHVPVAVLTINCLLVFPIGLEITRWIRSRANNPMAGQYKAELKHEIDLVQFYFWHFIQYDSAKEAAQAVLGHYDQDRIDALMYMARCLDTDFHGTSGQTSSHDMLAAYLGHVAMTWRIAREQRNRQRITSQS